ncbi:pantoate--beta-alanine ligase [Primorskyibacter sp. S87]|uniref:pantoate--beta-alanine ligase n=1 Tax=Primorskyibacter sp. S87 TaxID=3415126 RepID=UPI003C7E376F
MTAPIIRTLEDLRALTAGWRLSGEAVGVVPTMGALHAGHLSLVEAAKSACDRVIVTIFVNPRQFNRLEDLKNYPRTEQEDAVKLAPFAVDVVYVPDPNQVYPDGFSTNVSLTGVTDVMEGPNRPGHFDGVATVVAKLFLQTGADKAFFGEKDYQQLMVVRHMARDLDIPVEVVGCPTVREPSGLAMSSRNLRLSEQGLLKAAVLFPTLQEAAAALSAGAGYESTIRQAQDRLIQSGFEKVEYLELHSAASLAALTRPSEPARLFAAAWVEGIRLIDNIPVARI